MRQVDPQVSPRFAGISTFARLPVTTNLDGVKAAFIGVPYDDATTFRPGARFGPSAIRQGSRLLRPYNPFIDVYPFDFLNACDYGDLQTVPGYTEDTTWKTPESLGSPITLPSKQKMIEKKS